MHEQFLDEIRAKIKANPLEVFKQIANATARENADTCALNTSNMSIATVWENPHKRESRAESEMERRWYANIKRKYSLPKGLELQGDSEISSDSLREKEREKAAKEAASVPNKLGLTEAKASSSVSFQGRKINNLAIEVRF